MQLPPMAAGVAEGVGVDGGVLDAVTDAAVTALVGAIAKAIQAAAAPAPNSARIAAVPITNCLTRLFNTFILGSAGPRARLRRPKVPPRKQLGRLVLSQHTLTVGGGSDRSRISAPAPPGSHRSAVHGSWCEPRD